MLAEKAIVNVTTTHDSRERAITVMVDGEVINVFYSRYDEWVSYKVDKGTKLEAVIFVYSTLEYFTLDTIANCDTLEWRL